MAKDLNYYKKLIPSKISVSIRRDSGGYYAKIKELPHCYTQASTYAELVEMINDAIYTHLNIPVKYRKFYYVPEQIVMRMKQLQYDRMFREIIKNFKEKETKKIFVPVC